MKSQMTWQQQELEPQGLGLIPMVIEQSGRGERAKGTQDKCRPEEKEGRRPV